jgi:hypothetical protein
MEGEKRKVIWPQNQGRLNCGIVMNSFASTHSEAYYTEELLEASGFQGSVDC